MIKKAKLTGREDAASEQVEEFNREQSREEISCGETDTHKENTFSGAAESSASFEDDFEEQKLIDQIEMEASLEDEDEDIWGASYMGYDGGEDKNRRMYDIIPHRTRPTGQLPLTLVKVGHPAYQYVGHMLHVEGDFQTFHRCLEDYCPLCRAGVQKVHWRVELFFSLTERRIVYLEFRESDKPHSLHYQLQKALRGGVPAAVRIGKASKYEFEAKRITPAPDLNHGASVVRRFRKALDAGEIDIDCLIPQATQSKIDMDPEVNDLLHVLGLRSEMRD